MFKTGAYIICGQHGVCRVEDIGTLKLSEASKGKIYYTLSQVYSKGGVIYVPAESEKIVMRQIVSRNEAEALIDEMDDMESLWVANEKRREETFKDALRTCDYRNWVKVIKTIYERKMSRMAQGKKVTASDERYLHMAEDNLYGELALALDMDRSEVERYITERINGREKIEA